MAEGELPFQQEAGRGVLLRGGSLASSLHAPPGPTPREWRRPQRAIHLSGLHARTVSVKSCDLGLVLLTARPPWVRYLKVQRTDRKPGDSPCG